MRALAHEWNQDSQLWELVGLLHDIDWDVTQDKKDNHGIIAAELLKGKLSEEALHAIMSHDYRTGVSPISKIDKALVFADALAHIFVNMREVPKFEYFLFEKALIETTEKGRPWMEKIIQNYIKANNINPTLFGQIYYYVRKCGNGSVYNNARGGPQ